jgi:hypothetical protein
MQDQDFTVINVGLSINGQPMSKPQRVQFEKDIRAFFYTQGQPIVGYAKGTSEYQGQKESFLTFHVLISPHKHAGIRNYLAGLARLYKQESIAYLVSTPNDLIDAQLPLADRYL